MLFDLRSRSRIRIYVLIKTFKWLVVINYFDAVEIMKVKEQCCLSLNSCYMFAQDSAAV